MPTITMIVAIDAAGGIGSQNSLPWKLAEDMAFFKRTTTGHTVLMGRKTFESIGRPLPNRINIVISRDPTWQHEGVLCANSIENGIALAAPDAQVFIIGGAQIYAASQPLAQAMLVTEIDKTFGCDAFFPPISASEWQEVARTRHFSSNNDCHFSFVEYRRLPASKA